MGLQFVSGVMLSPADASGRVARYNQSYYVLIPKDVADVRGIAYGAPYIIDHGEDWIVYSFAVPPNRKPDGKVTKYNDSLYVCIIKHKTPQLKVTKGQRFRLLSNPRKQLIYIFPGEKMNEDPCED